MIIPGQHGLTCYQVNIMLLLHSNHSMSMFKLILTLVLKPSGVTMELNSLITPFMNSFKPKESFTKHLAHTHHNKMLELKENIGNF